jgi:suppressor of ftsI
MLGASVISCFDDDAAPLGPTFEAARVPGDLWEPPVLRSANGILSTDITCGTKPVTIAGRKYLQAVTYNDSYPGPTLWVRPGDFVTIRFTNRIVHDEDEMHAGYGRPPRASRMTNLHFHGMHISPTGNADNMTIMVPSNGSQLYSFQVPANHPAGLYWYHAHVHGLVTNQVSRGAAGMLVVANAHTDQLTNLGIRRRLMMLQQAYLDEDEKTMISDDGNRDDPLLAMSLINGALMPDIYMRPGEPQVWSLLNASSSAFYLLQLEGHTFDVVAEDGLPLILPRLGLSQLLLASGNRVEVVVRANGAGRYALSYASYNQGVDTWPAKSIGTVVVTGEQWNGADYPGHDTSPSLQDLSLASIAENRVIVFGTDTSVAEGEYGRFTINGHPWDPNYSEWTSKLGTVEEWVIRNETEQEHPFHVHTNPFQVTRINNAPVAFRGYQDVASVPRFGEITVRTRFTDFVGGPIVMHCHILDHEDMGMMTRFEIA